MALKDIVKDPTGKGARRKRRDRAEDLILSELSQGFGDIASLQGPFSQQFATFLSPDARGGLGSMATAGVDASRAVLSAIQRSLGLLEPGGEALPYGLNAPGVLPGLIGQGQADVARSAQQGIRQASNLIPDFGGAGARAASDVAVRAAGAAGGIGSGLRAQAAEQDLASRLGIISTLGELAPRTAAGFQTALAGGLLPFQFQQGLIGQRMGLRELIAGIRGGFLQSQNKRDADLYGGLGQLFGQGLSALPFLFPGGASGAAAGGAAAGGAGGLPMGLPFPIM